MCQRYAILKTMNKKIYFVIVGLIGLFAIFYFISATMAPKIEREHVYESEHLTVSLPGNVDTVELLGQLANEDGDPDVVLLVVQNNTRIRRDPLWFSDDQEVESFVLRALGESDFRVFYWMSPEYTLSEYIEEFQKLPAPIITDFELFETEHHDSISILFERSIKSKDFYPLNYKTKVVSNEQPREYIQWAVWASDGSTPGKEVWNISFDEFAPGNSAITVSSILMTEVGNYEIPSNTISIPYEISDPYNLIENFYI